MPRRFNAIVIGSGLGGLTAAALCARAGFRVLVLERNDSFGGAATVYRHNGLAIEARCTEIDGLDEDDPKTGLIRSLGLDRDLEFIERRRSLRGARRPCRRALRAASRATRMHSLPPSRVFRDTIRASKNISNGWRNCAVRYPGCTPSASSRAVATPRCKLPGSCGRLWLRPRNCGRGDARIVRI